MRLKEYRQRAGLSQSELADMLGTTQATVQRWETSRHIPRQREMQRIAEKTAGAVTPNDFVLGAAGAAEAVAA